MPAAATTVAEAPQAVSNGPSVQDDLQRLCAEVLKRPVGRVKPHRSFVALGGDSLLAVKLMGRCRAAGYAIQVRDVLQAASLAELCKRVQIIGNGNGTGPGVDFSSDVDVEKNGDGVVVNGAKGREEPNGKHETTTTSLTPNITPQIASSLTHLTPSPLLDIDDIFPCSPTQEMFLLAQALHPKTYQCTIVLQLQSDDTTTNKPLDIPRLRAAWDQLVLRHASLRTVFVSGSAERAGHFDQVVLKRGIVPLEVVDDTQGCTVETFSQRQPLSFPLARPTHRVALYNNADGAAYLRLDMTHALVDGESFYVILRDIGQAYAGQDLQAKGPCLPYRGFVTYQHQLPRQLSTSYWSTYLSGAEPSWFPVQNEESGEGHTRGELRVKRLRLTNLDFDTVCAHSNVTVANICQVAWALVLRAYTTNEEVCFSYVHSGRHAALQGIEDAVGAFAETMICRVALGGTSATTTLAQVLEKAKQDTLQALMYPTTAMLAAGGEQAQMEEGKPFARLRGNTLVSCQRMALGEATRGSGLVAELVDAWNPSEYDLSVGIQVGKSELDISIDYWSARTDDKTIAGVADSFAKALQQIIRQDADHPTLDIVPPAHIAQLRAWNNTIPLRVATRIQDRVYAQRVLHPDALAVQGWDGDLTYRELDDTANTLAAYLTTLGVQPETKVPLVFAKSKWALISQLAVLKAGGCVVPLAVNQPMQRTEVMLRDMGAGILLTSGQLASRYTDLLDRVLVVDEAFLSTLPTLFEPPICPATPDSTAFLIYTSGSTGIPKGVVLTHGSLSTSLDRLASKFGLDRTTCTTRMVQFSAYTFDISIQDIYTTWQTGGCLCVISEDDRTSDLAGALRKYDVNCAGLTSTVAGFLAPEDVPGLKTLVLLGEAVKPAVVDRWLGHAAVFNAYGPSECSIQSSCRQLERGCNALNIGYALAGALWVVDANNYNRLVPIGAPGELLIEGPLLAREYLNDPVKTAAAFISDPAWISQYGFGTGQEQRRMYRTGDLVCQNPDGSIIYIGRRDTQIKVRGQRVEVGDIEHHALQHAAVLDGAVVFPRQGCFQGRLVGLLTLQEFSTPTANKTDVMPVSRDKLTQARRVAGEVGEYLTALVPEHMIPQVWIPLASKMPQNESGKLDRKRLGLWVEDIDSELFEALTAAAAAVAAGSGTEEQQAESSTPATPLELRIRQVWSQALRTPENQIAVHSRSFLGCGGDSITAMQVVSLCAAQGIAVAVRDVLQTRSIAQLALKARVRGHVRKENGNTPDEESSFPLSLAQRQLLALAGDKLRCDEAYRLNHSVCLRARAGRTLDRDDVARAVDALAIKHPMLRARFHHSSAGEISQLISPYDQSSYRFDGHEVESRDQAFSLVAEAEGTLDLERGPVFSALLIGVGGQTGEQLLFLSTHQLVADHASWRIILSDLDAFLNGASSPSASPEAFQKWIHQQSDGKRTEVDSRNTDVLSHWGVPENNLHSDEATEEIHLDERTTSLLLGDANRALRTQPVEIILAAVIDSFRQTFSDRAGPRVVEEVDGRDGVNGADHVTETVGQFARVVSLYAPVAGEEDELDVISLLRRTKDRRREVLATSLSLSSQDKGVEVLLRHIDEKQETDLSALEPLPLQDTSPIGALIQRPAVFTIQTSVTNNTLHLTLHYNRHARHCDKIRPWLQSLSHSLHTLASTLSASPSSLTRSDIPLVKLNQAGLDKLHSEVLPAAELAADDVESIYPCSPMQQGILLSQAKAPGAYWIRQRFAIRRLGVSKGDLNAEVSVERVAQAWQVLVDRHAMLRTVFVPAISSTEEQQHLFDQVVLRSHNAEIHHVTSPDDDDQHRLTFPPDLDLPTLNIPNNKNKPNHHITLASTPSGELSAILTINHALVDATALGVLQTELAQAYTGRLTTTLPAPRYDAFVGYLQQTEAEAALAFWRARLKGAQPLETETPSKETSYLSMVLSEIDAADVHALQSLSATLGVTPATVFQLAWGLVLSRYTGQAEVCFGYLTSGRDVPVARAAELVGPLVNIMVARLQMGEADVQLEEALHKVQGDFLDAFPYQRASLVDIEHGLGLSGGRLFNSCLSYRHHVKLEKHDEKEKEDGSGGITLEVIAAEDPTEYDVTVHVLVSGSAISVALQHQTACVSTDGATRLLDTFLQAVRSMATHPHSSLDRVRVLTPRDERTLSEWHAVDEVKESAQDCVPDLFLRQLSLHPHAPAISAWDGEMTYFELYTAASRLAHHLATNLAVGPEVMIPLCFDKSRWAIVAQLAVLLAGGVVVSVNPRHPAERLRGMLGDLGAKVMLAMADEAVLACFEGVVPCILAVDSSLLSQLPGTTSPAPTPTITPDNAAFIIYTSGSTGTPKGVVLTHGSLGASFSAHGKAFGMNRATRTLQFAAYTFDASISDIWATLTHGGCVCVLSEDERMNALPQAVVTYRANLAQLTPTVAGLLTQDDGPTTTMMATTLETVVFGGEAAQRATVERLLHLNSRIKVINGYGPTECSIYTTCSGPLTLPSQPSNIGRALAGGVWVVNTLQNTISPVGGVGELWIEGPLLARGYHRDPAKTDAQFVVNPSWASTLPQSQGCRFYRTGDIVRQNAAGEVLYIGRESEAQVKIRGQRVEMGEIEQKVKKAMPSGWSGMVAVTLVMPGGQKNNPMLAIAVEGNVEGKNTGDTGNAGNTDITEKANNTGITGNPNILPLPQSLLTLFAHLHTTLLATLPSYMVPRLLIPLTHLPFTSSAKLDRRLLRTILEGLPESVLFQYTLSAAASASAGAGDSSGGIAPLTATESKLQSLWARFLGVDPSQVGVRDHFLHVGGDSFTAMRLVAAANAGGFRLTVGDVFRVPVLRDMAGFLDGKGKRDKEGEDEKEEEEEEEETVRFGLWEDVQVEAGDNNALLTSELCRVADQCSVAVDAIEDVLPCTPMQEALMAATAQRPDAYVSRWVYRMPSGLDVHKFREAWSAVARAAPILRTRIVPGTRCAAVQVVLVRGELAWFDADGDVKLEKYLPVEEQKDMGYGTPLFRLAVVERHFILTAHHSGYDGWSLAKLLDAVAGAYHGQAIPSIAPFSRFLRFLTQQEKHPDTAKHFWQSQFPATADEDTPFPRPRHTSYRPNPAQSLTLQLPVAGSVPGNSSITLATLLRAAWALVVCAHTRHSATVFAEVRTGRAAAVRGILDVAGPVITAVPMRIPVENKGESVVEFLHAVQQQATDTLAFEHTGLRRVRQFVGRELGVGHLFTVQPVKAVKESRDGPGPGPATSTSPSIFLDMETISQPLGGVDDYALSVECRTDEHSIEVYARFDEAMVSPTLMQRLLGRFEHVLSQLATTSPKTGALLRDLRLLSPSELSQLSHWNYPLPPRLPTLVHNLVRHPSRTHPDSPAIHAWDGNLSHIELDRLAAQLAQHLVASGVGPETMVPVCFDKSRWAIVAMLAVLQAGGAVVPIGADPVQRAQTILRDVDAKVVLTSRRHVPQFKSHGVSHVISVDDTLFTDDLPASPTTTLESSVSPNNVAFVIYTSGSTGVPKGVVLEHGSMATSMQAHGARFGMCSSTRAFQFASFTFDISLHDMLTTLQFGGCVCMPSEEERVNDLAGVMRRMGVNYTFLPPRVLPTLPPGDVPSLRTLIVGGEALHARYVAGWLGEGRRVLNAYGPAECCIISTCREFGGEGAEGVEGVEASNIGHALAGRLWVVDETDPDRLVPLGAVGELLIEGPLLARGYLHDADKTRDAFIENPAWLAQYGLSSSTTTGGARRMYRTGDLVRQNEDGSLTYIGRRDSQVKVRGQRVEMGEVEHHVKQQRAVADAVVVLPVGGPAQARLVAVVTLRGCESESESSSEIQLLARDGKAARSSLSQARKQLHESLPSYMIPDVWIPLACMPQNTSHKADCKKLVQWLEAMDTDHFETLITTFSSDTDGSTAATTDTDRQLQTVVGHVLRLSTETVAMNRSFLSLGGDSISAMQVVSLSRTRHGLSVGVQDVLRSRSLADLSKAIAAKTRDSATKTADAEYVPFSLPPTRQLLAQSSALQQDLRAQAGVVDVSAVEDMYPCGPVQQGILMSQAKGQDTYRVRQVCEIRSESGSGSGMVDVNRLVRAWEVVVDRHAILRTVFIQTGSGSGSVSGPGSMSGSRSGSGSSQFYQVVLKQWKPTVRVIHCEQADKVVSAFAQEESRENESPISPDHRLTLCTTSSGSTYAQLDMSHALTDAASLRIMFRDITLAYTDRLPTFPAPSYGAYIAFTQQTPSQKSFDYWARRLRDAQPCFLPGLGAKSTTPKNKKWQTTTAQLTDLRVLHSFRNIHGVTLANLVHLAWAVVLARYTGSDQDEAVFGYLADGRDAPIAGAGESMVGPMINMMVARIALGTKQKEKGQKTVAEIAQQVQHDALDAFAHQRTSLGEIQHALRLGDHNKGLFNTVVSFFRPAVGSSSPASSSSEGKEAEQEKKKAGLTAEYVTGEDPTEYDLAVSILAGEHTMAITLKYYTSFLDELSAQHLLDSLRHTLLALAANPDLPMDELDVLAPSDVQLLKQWNVHLPAAVPGRADDQIREQSLLRPTAPAVRYWDEQTGRYVEMTYAELDALSEQLAQHLRSLEVVDGAEAMVGLCFEKSLWAIVSMLAVAKAGGVVVPLGIQLPPQRLRLLLDNARVGIVLTSRECASKFEHDSFGITIATVDADLFSSLPGVTPSSPPQSRDPDSAAVIIYTSGSTGLPKGVVLTHSALCTSLHHHGTKLTFTPDTTTLQFSAYVFDVSLLEILGTLRFGGCICVPSEADRMDPARLATAMEAMRVNLAVLTPTVASLIQPEAVPSLRTLGLAGETVPLGLVQAWIGHCEVFNCYGPTECTVMSTGLGG
ncbi:hypothetical protein B0J18DRAFT_469876 [Chaetomium sp. MPI-SDFR-AT-0129]|nr:hypothetical protein B0J18DRAFT_469876 [Chaetomium sp. MPI-SDFR-AT-0129]